MKIPPEQRDVIVAMKEDGESVKDIAAHFGMTTDQVHYILAKASGRQRKERVVRPNDDLLYEMYILQGMTQQQIATRYMVSSTTIHNWLRDAEIEKETDIPDDFKWEYEWGGYTGEALAQKYNVPNGTIKSWIVRTQAKKRNFTKRGLKRATDR